VPICRAEMINCGGRISVPRRIRHAPATYQIDNHLQALNVSTFSFLLYLGSHWIFPSVKVASNSEDNSANRAEKQSQGDSLADNLAVLLIVSREIRDAQ